MHGARKRAEPKPFCHGQSHGADLFVGVLGNNVRANNAIGATRDQYATETLGGAIELRAINFVDWHIHN